MRRARVGRRPPPAICVLGGASEGLAWVVDGLAFVRLQPAARLPVWPGWLGRDEMVSEVAARHAQAHRSSSEVRVTSRGVVAV